MTTDQVSPSTPSAGPAKKGFGFLQSLGPAGVVPLAVLFGLNMVDEFDRVAFGTLSPEIRDAFGLSDADFIFITVLSSALAILLSIPIGVLSDRRNRVRIAQFAALIWAVASVGTGLAPVVIVLMLARFSSGVGRLVNEPVHPSLLSDYYPPAQLPRIFAIHRFANNLGLLAGPVAGFMLVAFDDWRPIFLVMAVPTVVLIIFSTFLTEPRRGATSTREIDDAKITFVQAFKRLWGIRSFRRVWAAAFFFGSGAIPLATFLSLFFDNVYGVGSVGRGYIQLINGVGGAAGLVIGQRLARRALSQGKAEPIPIFTSLLVIEFGLGVLLMAISPSLALSVTFVFVLSVGAQGFLPPYLTVVSLVSDPRVRSQAYSYSLFFFALGGVILSRISATFADRAGWRPGMMLLASFVVIGGLIGTTVRKYIAHDLEEVYRAG